MYLQERNKKSNLKKALAYMSLFSLASAKTLSLPLQIVQGNANISAVSSPVTKRNYVLPDNIYQAFSLMSYEIGGEAVSSIVDTGSSILWLGNSKSSDTNMQYLCENSACVDVTSMSPAATDMDYSYPITYAQGVTVNPEFYESTLAIAGVDVTDFNFGVVDTYPEFNRSVFGLRNMNGYDSKANLISNLKTQGFISSESFSMSYDGPITLKGGTNPVLAEGEIVFGGYNSDDSSSDMKTFTIDDNTQFTALKSVSLKKSSSASSSIASVSVSGDTVLDSGTTTALIIPGLSTIINSIDATNGIWTCADYEDYVVQLELGSDILEIPLNNMAGKYGDDCYMFFSDGDVGVNIIGQFVMTNIVSYWDYDSNVVGIMPLNEYATWVDSSSTSSTSSAQSSSTKTTSSTSSTTTSSKVSSTSSSVSSSESTSSSSAVTSTTVTPSSTAATSSESTSTSSAVTSTKSTSSSSAVTSSTVTPSSTAATSTESTSTESTSTSSAVTSTKSTSTSSAVTSTKSTSSSESTSTSSAVTSTKSTSSSSAVTSTTVTPPSTAATSTESTSTTGTLFIAPIYSNTTVSTSSESSTSASSTTELSLSGSSSVTSTEVTSATEASSTSKVTSTSEITSTNAVTSTSTASTAAAASTSATSSSNSPIGDIFFLPNSIVDGLAKFAFMIDSKAFDTIVVIAKAAEDFILDLDNIFAGTSNDRITPSDNFSNSKEAYLIYNNFDRDTFQFSLHEHAQKSGVTSASQQFDIYVPVNSLKRDTAYMKISILSSTNSSESSILSTSVVTALETPSSANFSTPSNSTISASSSLLSSSAASTINPVSESLATGKMLTATLEVVASSAATGLAAVSVSTDYQSSNITTVITKTSCSDNKCSKVVSTALESIATETIDGVVTEYTTYCPLSSVAKTTTMEAVQSTTPAPQVVTVSSTQANSTASVSSLYEGGAAQNVGSLAVLGLVGFLFV